MPFPVASAAQDFRAIVENHLQRLKDSHGFAVGVCLFWKGVEKK